MQVHITFIAVPLLLIAAALFAAAEAALFSLSRTQLEALRESYPAFYRRIRLLLGRPDSLLLTFVIGNECLNISIGTMIASYLELRVSHWHSIGILLLSVVVSTALMLTCSEVLPKVLAFRMPTLLSVVLVYPLSWGHALLTPLRKIFLWVCGWVLKAMRIPVISQSAVSEKDFLTLVEVGTESGSLERQEQEMISNVFHFSDLAVSSVMTPWEKVFCVPESIPFDELLEKLKKRTLSRIPVISDRDGHVVGILYTKQLLESLLVERSVQDRDLFSRAILPPHIVSIHKKVAILFREFKTKKIHMALVVDEYGRHMGLVTLEDLLNSLFQTQRRAEEVPA